MAFPLALADDDRYEVQPLRSMTSVLGSAGRSSAIPVGLFVKFEVSKENREKAEQARKEREERDLIRLKAAQRQYEETQKRREKARAVNATVKEDMIARNLEQGRVVRAHKSEWEQLRQEAMQRAIDQIGENRKSEAASRAASTPTPAQLAEQLRQSKQEAINGQQGRVPMPVQISDV